jgi:hypothetical protein
MQATTTINSTDANHINYRNEPTASVRVLQNAILTELPGIAFAVLTLVYIGSSLVRL